MKKSIFIFLTLCFISISCLTIESQTINLNSIIKDYDSITILQNYKYPKKWEQDINNQPMYNSLKDSLADINFTKLYIYSRILYDTLKTDKVFQQPLTIDLELFNLFVKKEMPLYFDTHVWDKAYKVGTILKNDNYILNLYKDGQKYNTDSKQNKNKEVKKIINYLLLESFNVKTKEKDYLLVFTEDNNRYQLYNRFFSIDKKNIIIISDFYLDEITNVFYGTRKYEINSNGKFELIK